MFLMYFAKVVFGSFYPQIGKIRNELYFSPHSLHSFLSHFVQIFRIDMVKCMVSWDEHKISNIGGKK